MGEHVEEPASETVIWRYMDFIKFVAMLERGGLYFSRADLLGDPFEGTFSPRSVDEFCAATGRSRRDGARWSDILTDLRQQSYVSCWHESDRESAALWQLYGNSIAIKATVGGLRTFLGTDYNIARVVYIDYSDRHPDITNSVGALLYKRAGFSHEREIRAVQQRFTYEGDRIVPAGHPGFPGEYAQGDLNALIECIVVAPQTPDWQRELTFMVARRFNLDKVCYKSEFDIQRPWV